MKKVMVVIPALGSGGGERLAVSLIAKMDPQIIKQNWLFYIPMKTLITHYLQKKNAIDTVYLNKHRGVDFSIVGKLKKEIDTFMPDVIQTHLYVVGICSFSCAIKR